MKPLLLAPLAALALVPAIAQAQPTPAPAPAPTPAPAPAPTPAATPQKRFVPGLAIASVPDVVANSNAQVNAVKERQIVYKTQIGMADARTKQINAELAPLLEKFNRDRQAGNVAQADLQRQAQAIQAMQQAGQQEVNNMLAPVALSEAYVQEQIGDVINKAITNAMDKNGITLVLPPQSPLAFNNSYNMSAAVLTELNALLPSAKVVPPQGWQPRAVREAQAAQAAQQTPQQAQAAQPARPARRLPGGR